MTIQKLTEEMKGQKQVLGDINTNIQKLANSFTDFNKEASLDRLNRRERERDEKQKNQKEKQVQQQQQASKGSGGGIFSALGIGAGAGFGLAGAASIATAGAKRLIAPALLMSTADDVADYLEKNGTDKEGADAVARAMQTGGIGLIFGKKGMIAGALLGAVLTEENQTKLKELGTSIQERGVEIKDYVKELGIVLPSVGTVMNSMAEGFGGILDFSNSIVKGEFKQAFDAFGEASKPILYAMAAKNGMNVVKGLTDKKLEETKLTKSERRIQQSNFAKNMSDKQIQKMADQGITVDKKSGTFKNSKGKFVGVDRVSEAFKDAGIKGPSATLNKYPRLKMLKMLPIGRFISVAGISSILANNELSEKEKVTQVAGMFGGIGAGAIGGMLGGLLGLIGGGGVLSAITGGVGSLAGAIALGYLGDEAAQMMVASALMGNDKPMTDFAKSMGLIRDTSTPAPTMIDEFGVDMTPYTGGGGSNTLSKSNTSSMNQSNALNSGINEYLGLQSQPNYVVIDNSSTNQNNVSNNTSGNSFLGNPIPWDYNDPMNATR